jgi:hypothetical protein
MLSLRAWPKARTRTHHSRRLLGSHPRRLLAAICVTVLAVSTAAFLPSRVRANVEAAGATTHATMQTLRSHALPGYAISLHAFR